MPQVPVYDTPTVAPQGLPGATQQVPYHLSTFAAQAGRQESELGQGMARAGGELVQQAAEQQIAQNEATVKDHDAKLMGAIQGVLYGTPDAPGSGYLNQKGKDALDTFDATAEKLKGLGVDIGNATLQNPAQQDLAKAPTQIRIQSAITQALQHRDQQSNVYQKAAGDVRIKVAQEGAPLAFNAITDTPLASFDQGNPGANSQYQQYLQTIQSEAADQADRQGLTDPDLRDAFVKNALARAYTLTVSHLIDRKNGSTADLATAKNYFDAVKDQLPPEVQDKVKAVLEAGMTKDQALNVALDVKGRIGGIDAQEQALDAKFKAGDITADVHDIALQKLRADNTQRRSEQGENDKAMLGNVWDLAQKGGSLSDLSPSQYAYIKQRGLGPNVDAIFNRANKADFDDSQQYSDLMRMSAEDPAGFANMDLAKVSGDLTGAHWNHLMDIQRSINRQDTRAMAINKVAADAVRDTRANLLSAGINLNPKPNTDAAKQLEQFTTSLHDALTAAQPDWQAKKLTPAQMRDQARTITLGMLKDQALSGTGYFGSSVGQTHMPIWKMTSAQRTAPWDVPDADRQQIVDSLTRAGLPASEDNIQRAYKAAQGVR